MTEESLDKLRELIEQAKRFVATSRKNWGRTATDPGPFVLHNSGDIQRFCSDLSHLQQLLEVMDQQCDAVEMRKTESSFGDAYDVSVAVEVSDEPHNCVGVPDRVKAAPAIVMWWELHGNSEAAFKSARELREKHVNGVQVFAGGLAGLKELVCSQLQTMWSICRF